MSVCIQEGECYSGIYRHSVEDTGLVIMGSGPKYVQSLRRDTVDSLTIGRQNQWKILQATFRLSQHLRFCDGSTSIR